ncbi:MAG: protein kinase [Candidatus Anammoximicrobium sp.]|nr:protein kinase [Candidatus Anammoximicrobium sp.]
MSSATADRNAVGLADPDQQELLAILDDFVDRLQRGESVDAEEIIRAHPEAADQLRGYLDSLVFLQRALPPSAALDTDLLAASRDETCRLGEFEILRELGRGGMGIVYEAMQVSLGRRVALKVLPFAAVLNQEQLARFTIEAQAAARLHHPHIVPVYSVGCERGVHYYSMQFVDGRSLDVMIEELRRTKRGKGIGESPAAADDTAKCFSTAHFAKSREFFLSVAKLGAQVADALQHAHDGGIIHRDIKPSNILIDRAGKPWVTDFGLARCRGDASLTSTGAVIGSVRYMSPEQALGRTRRVDQRTDVYSLGITLYELLTLRKAFDAGDQQQFLRQIEQEEPAPLRRIDPAVPTDLETIVLKAISKQRSDRYRTAREFADDLRRFAAGQPIRARRPSWSDRISKWAGRHRSLVTLSFVFLIAALAGTATAALLIVRQQAQTRRALQLAEQNLKQAEENLRQAGSVVDHFGLFAAQRLGDIPGTESLRRELLGDTLRYYRQFIQRAGQDPSLQTGLAVAHFKSAEILERLGEPSEALQSYERAATVLHELSRDPAATNDTRTKLAMCYNNIGLLRANRGETEPAWEAYRKAITLQEGLVADEPANSVCERDLALTLGNLGLLHGQTGRIQDAWTYYERAIQIQERLLERQPDDATLRRRLAGTYNNVSFLYQTADPAKALEFSSRSLAILRPLATAGTTDGTAESDLGLALNNHGSLLARSGQLDAARKCYTEAVEVYERLATGSPAIVRHQLDLAVATNNLGRTLNRLGQQEAAQAAIDKACGILQRLVEASPSDVNYRSTLGGALNNLGLAHERAGRLDDALSAYQNAVEHQQAARDAAPDVQQIGEFLAKSQDNLRRVQALIGQNTEVLR